MIKYTVWVYVGMVSRKQIETITVNIDCVNELPATRTLRRLTRLNPLTFVQHQTVIAPTR